MNPFVLLDDAHRGSATLLTDLRHVDHIDLTSIDAALAGGWAKGWHCFAWLPYELGPGALYWFAGREVVDADDWLPDSPAWLADVRHDVSAEEFADTVAALQEEIADGTSYQVNYTHRVWARLLGEPPALYARLRRRQSVAFGVLAHLPRPASAWILSLSPELFLHVEGRQVLSRPMKGTAPAETDPEALRLDPKNRAENLMIVDLLRNDLSRIADDVTVPALFEIERVGRLWQMTSTVTGTLRADTSTGDLLKATFPCGSITGAPKSSSMELIRRHERDPRGIYTGSLGLIEPDRMVLNIAIRTVEVDADGTTRLGIGSGIVADSTATGEWEECLAKAAFATSLRPQVHLLETMRVIDGVAPLAHRHRSRLATSATELGFVALGDPIGDAIAGTPPGRWRVRVDVAPHGATTVTRTPLADDDPQPVVLRLATRPWARSALSAHKTSDRAALDAATAEAHASGRFDTVGHTSTGEVLEGGRTSVFARIDGRWLTPPVALGILDGVQRAEVLANPALLGADEVTEEAFTVADLRRADAIVVTNAVRGVMAATLED